MKLLEFLKTYVIVLGGAFEMLCLLQSLVYLALVAIFLVLWYFWATPNHWQKLNIYYLPPIPVFGNICSYVLRLKTFRETYDQLYRAAGEVPYFGYYEYNLPVLMLKDPQLIYTILIKDSQHFRDRRSPFIFSPNRQQNHLSVHLSVTKGNRWKEIRHKVSPIFTSDKVKQICPQVIGFMGSTDEYISRAINGRASGPIELKELFDRLILDVFGSYAFGTQYGALESNDEVRKMGLRVFAPTLRRSLNECVAVYFPSLIKLINWHEISRETIDFLEKMILDLVQYRRMHAVKRDDLLQLLMNLQNAHVDPKFEPENGERILKNEIFDEIDIVANSFLYLISGFEVTATILSFCVYELALNKDIQQKLRSEVQQVQQEFGQLDYNSIKEMSYMEAVISETLRKYEAIAISSRECTEDYIIPDTNICIPRGTSILIPTRSIHHDCKYYPNPELFDPERFIGNNKYDIPNGAYLPFGGGPRICPAERFAKLEMKTVLSDLISKYNFSPCEKTEMPLRYKKGGMFAHIVHGIWININQRKF